MALKFSVQEILGAKTLTTELLDQDTGVVLSGDTLELNREEENEPYAIIAGEKEDLTCRKTKDVLEKIGVY